MLEKLKDWVRQWLGIKVDMDENKPVDDFVHAYESLKSEDITATIANKLAMLVFADSDINIKERGRENPGQRVALIEEIIGRMWQDGVHSVAQAFGKGGKMFVPACSGGKIRLYTMDQNRMRINRMDGGKIVWATLIADVQRVDDRKYYLLADYELTEAGQAIRYRVVTDDNAVADLSVVEDWAQITPEITIAGTDRLLLAHLKCPRDNRTDRNEYGVPITYGAEKLIAQMVEHSEIYRREFKLTRPMLGLDSSLWKNPNANAKSAKSAGIAEIKATVQDSEFPFIPTAASAMDAKGMWQYFAPAIRDSAMEARYQHLCRRVEKACGLSQGILTERQDLNYANRDEVRAAQYDTFSVIKAMRDAWEQAVQDAAYAVDVLAERFGVTPYGNRERYEISFDWDTSLIEASAEAFAQWSELNSRGMISDPELRQWVMGGTLEEAEAAINKIRAEGGSESQLEKLLRDVEKPVDKPQGAEE